MSALIDFESSWEKSAERNETRKQREIVLEKAKHEYEKRERKKEQAKLRGEDTWMLASVNDRIQSEQKEIEKSKSKKTKKKKKKKDKKKKSKKKDSSSSSESDSESEPQWVEKAAEAPVVGVIKGPKMQRDNWMLAPMALDSLPSVSRAELRAKKQEEEEEKKRQQEMLNQAGQHKRELNPYWRDGGSGLPENDPSKRNTPSTSKPVVLGDGGVGWLKKALKRCYEQAEEEKRDVEEIAAEKYGSLSKLKSMLKEAEVKLEQQKAQIRAERNKDNQPRTDRNQPRNRSISRDRKYQSRHRSRSSDRKYKTRSSRSRSKSSDRKYKSKSSRSRSRSTDRKYKRGNRGSDMKQQTRSRSRSRDRIYQSRNSDDKDQKYRRRSSSSSSSDSSSSSSSSDSSQNKSRDRKYQSKRRSRSRDRKYQSNERTNSSSRFKKPRSDSDDNSYDRRSSSSYSKSSYRDSYNKSSYRDSYSKSSSRTSDSKSSSSRFKKPCSDSEDSDHKHSSKYSKSTSSRDHSRVKSNESQPGWKKKGFVKPASDNEDSERTKDRTERTFRKPGESSKDYKRSRSPPRESSSRKKEPAGSNDDNKRKKSESSSDSSSSSSSSSSESEAEKGETTPDQKAEEPVVLLSEEEMNKLGAKILKAEIMGNDTLAAELKAKLEACRKAKMDAPKDLQAGSSQPQKGTEGDEERVVVLTRTDKRGMVRPLGEREHPKEPKQGRRKKKQKVETHAGNQGDRTRYFHDDDQHDLKSLVEQEKMGTAEDSNMMFARLAGRSLEKTSDDYQLDDVLVDRASQKESESKKEDRDRFMAIMEHKKVSKAMENCQLCFDKVPKHLIIAIGIKCYLCLPNHKSLTEGHCLIVPMQHVTQGTVVDEDVWDEIKVFRKGLTAMFEEEDEDCVFMEMSRNLNYHPHMYIDCVPMPKEVGDMAPIYFKKAIMESESEWSQNKKLVDLSQKDVRRSVPKGFPYFSVDFGLQGGFAHVIEDEKEFPPYFGREVVGGMLDVGPEHWRKPRKENFEDQRKKLLKFSELWKPYDWTQRLTANS